MENNLLVPKPNRAWHNLSYQNLTTMKIGELTPVGIIETVPGGKYNIGNETIVRLQPLVTPIMHRMDIKVHTFYVPFRTLWTGFELFVMGKKDPITNLAPIHPSFDRTTLRRAPSTDATLPRLADYFGFRHCENPYSGNVDIGENIPMSPMPFAAYQHIYNNYYRHKTVAPEVPYLLQDGDNTPQIGDLTTMRNITFEDDYFNLALPSPQIGLPVFVDGDGTINATTANTAVQGNSTDIAINGPVQPNANDGITTELFSRTRIIMEEIRRAARLQEFVETERHATTYKDYLQLMYDANLPDFRAQIPVYINGFSQPIIVSEVTGQGDSFQGRQTGNAGSYSTAREETFYAHEHGYIISIAAVTYKPSYNAAMPRFTMKTKRFDYFHPQFDTLGERALYRGELMGHTENPLETFGYMPQNSEYRHTFDRVSGEMATINKHWHLGRNLSRTPLLSSDFFEVNDERRIFAFQDRLYSPIIVQTMHHIKAELPIPQLSRPTI